MWWYIFSSFDNNFFNKCVVLEIASTPPSNNRKWDLESDWEYEGRTYIFVWHYVIWNQNMIIYQVLHSKVQERGRGGAWLRVMWSWLPSRLFICWVALWRDSTVTSALRSRCPYITVYIRTLFWACIVCKDIFIVVHYSIVYSVSTKNKFNGSTNISVVFPGLGGLGPSKGARGVGVSATAGGSAR